MDLVSACDNEDEAKALDLLNDPNIFYNYKDVYGDNALVLACKHKMEKLALRLLEKENIDYNHINSDGYTALMWACKNNMETVALRLIDMPDIDHEHSTEFDYSAIDLAEDMHIVYILLKSKEVENEIVRKLEKVIREQQKRILELEQKLYR
jgi:ankyrin repeat protein